jgi:hypothetical protein
MVLGFNLLSSQRRAVGFTHLAVLDARAKVELKNRKLTKAKKIPSGDWGGEVNCHPARMMMAATLRYGVRQNY